MVKIQKQFKNSSPQRNDSGNLLAEALTQVVSAFSILKTLYMRIRACL